MTREMMIAILALAHDATTLRTLSDAELTDMVRAGFNENQAARLTDEMIAALAAFDTEDWSEDIGRTLTPKEERMAEDLKRRAAAFDDRDRGRN